MPNYKTQWNKGKVFSLAEKIKYYPNRISNEKIFVTNSSYKSKHRMKKRIIEEKLLPIVDRCNHCGQGLIWNNKPLVLELEHKDGVNNNNNLDNLEMLCPNCHSQTKTYKSKNIVYQIKKGKNKSSL